MLEQLTIKNVAVIDKLSVTFDNGLSVLTGETGAGKSIIIDSINMILGDRARKELIRNGTDYAQVEAVFEMTDTVREVLTENDIDCDDDCVIITRKITTDGKSTARINGSAVTLNMLRDIADMLINIHGQHDNQALLTPRKHIGFLDSFAKDDAELDTYRDTYQKRNAVKKELDKLLANVGERMQRVDLLAYQVNEINAANLTEDEEEELVSERNILERAEEIQEN
ncbi:MAG: AAA family ATPase, partial [Clostridia bacterium]|nr:AAA family ATPase [Clostridia bacterium]